MSGSLLTDCWLSLTALAGGVVNAIAGGGTLLTFPALLGVVSPVIANATSKVALVPGSLGGAVGYRRELQGARTWVLLLIAPSLVGGVVGTLLVTRLESRYFEAVIPWLLVLACMLFLAQPALARWIKKHEADAVPSARTKAVVIACQFLLALYGGYFGAGIGVLMLAMFSLLGIGNIHQCNALKNFLATWINGVSAITFVVERKVDWRFAVVMAGMATVGGYAGAHFGRRLPGGLLRWIVVIVGLGLAAEQFLP